MLLVLSACHHATGSREPARWARLGRRCARNAPASSLPAARRDSLPPTPAGSRIDDDDRWVRLARTVPGGFGGYFVRSSDGRETIYLKEPEKRGEALVALNARPVTGVTIGADVVVVRGRWDYVQLYEWYRYLVPRLSGTRLVSTDLDEGENRILLGVEDEPSRRRLERRLAALDVPCFLVAIEVGPPPRSVFRRAAAAKTAAAPGGRRP